MPRSPLVRLSALAALVCPLAMAVVAVVALAGDVAIAVLAVVLLLGASAAIWVTLTNRGGTRIAGAAASALAVAGLVVVLATHWQGVVVLVALLALLALFGLTARYALGRTRAQAVVREPRIVVRRAGRRGRGGGADHQPQVRGREGRALPTRGRGPPARDRAGDPRAGRRPAAAGRGRRRPRRTGDRDGGRRRLPGTGRDGGGAPGRAPRVHPGRNPQPLRARPRARPRRRRRRARRLHRRARAADRPRAGQRPRVRQQRLAGRVREGGPVPGLSRRQAADVGRDAARPARPGGAPIDLEFTTPDGTSYADAPLRARLEQPLPAHQPGGSGHAGAAGRRRAGRVRRTRARPR